MATKPRFCLVIRVFSETEAEMPAMRKRLTKTLEQARGITLPGSSKPFFKKILILVWENRTGFPTCSDCGQSFALCQKYFNHLEPHVEVHKVSKGDVYVGATNYALEYLCREPQGNWLMFISPEVHAHLTPVVCDTFFQAANDGARYVGVALDDRGRRGFTGNTLAAWHVEALWHVGGFVSILDKEWPPTGMQYCQYWDGSKITSIAISGAEEVVPMARLVVKFGARLAVISQDSSARMDISGFTDERFAAHSKKIATKQIRQEAMLYAYGLSPNLIEYGTKSY